MSNFNKNCSLVGIALLVLSACPLMAVADDETTFAGPFGSWAEVKANQGEVSVLGYVLIRSAKRLEFKSATGDKGTVNLLMQKFTDPKSFEQIQSQSKKFNGVIPVVVSGNFSKRPMKPRAGNPNGAITGGYKGPFYDFNIGKVEILSRMDAEVTAGEIMKNPDVIKAYTGKIIPLDFENLKVFVDAMELKTHSTQVGNQREKITSLKVMTKLVTTKRPKAFLDAEVKVSDSRGEIEAIRNVTKYDSAPVNKLNVKHFWFKLAKKPQGDLKVEVTFKARNAGKDAEEQTQVYNYTVLAPRGPLAGVK